jgi:DNA-binding transcriptional LysR family regulator
LADGVPKGEEGAHVFELIQLRCFVAVAEELHFGRASQRLNMTQPPLSRHIQVLERIMKVELFHRSSRSVKLTAAGMAFLPEARRVVHLADSAIATARAAAEGKQGWSAWASPPPRATASCRALSPMPSRPRPMCALC